MTDTYFTEDDLSFETLFKNGVCSILFFSNLMKIAEGSLLREYELYLKNNK